MNKNLLNSKDSGIKRAQRLWQYTEMVKGVWTKQIEGWDTD